MEAIYSACALSAQQERHRLALKLLNDDMKDINIPDGFDASWRDMGLLNPDIALLIHRIIHNIELAKTWILSHPWLEEQPMIPGILSPFQAELKEAAMNEENRRLDIIATFVNEQIDYYEGIMKPSLEALTVYLEAEAEEYATQLGLDEKRKWLRAQAKARRDARRQSGRS